MLKADYTIYKLLPEMAIIKCGQVHKAQSLSRPVKGAAVNALKSERKIHWLPWMAVIGRVVTDFITTFCAPSLF